MNATVEQVRKMQNMLADNLGAVDALRRELRDSVKQHSIVLHKLDTMAHVTQQMLGLLNLTDKQASSTNAETQKTGTAETQIDWTQPAESNPPAMNDDAELTALYTDMLHEDRAQTRAGQ